MRRVAIIDLGSNSFRLVVFRYEPGGAWAVWDEIRAPVRLSAGMGADDVLRPAPVARALDTVRTFVAFCAETGIGDVVATGTSALRRAVNGAEVVAAMETAGLPVRLLDEREEAYYGALAILNSTSVADGFGLDIGGGSVQLMRFDGRRLAESASLPLGAVRTTERYLATESKAAFKALRRAVRAAVGELRWFGRPGAPSAGIGGSVRNLAAAAQRLQELPNGGVQGFRLTRAMVSELVSELTACDVAARRELPGVNPDRGDVILAAAIVLEEILDAGGLDALETTEAGLREGLFYERYLEGVDPPVLDDVRRSGVRNLVLRYGREPAHSARVALLALELYDGLAAEGALDRDDDERELLEAAALLHDIGRAIGFDDRHKHARYLILSEGLPGFSREATGTIAQIVRYVPKGSPEGDRRVELLAGVLRIAERLERSRTGMTDSVSVRCGGRGVDVLVEARGAAQVGLWAAHHSTDLLADALRRPVRVRDASGGAG